MWRFWQEMGQLPKWKYILFVSYDSHGLQLLIKYISELLWFKDMFKLAQHIVGYFYTKEKQLALPQKE